MPERAHHKKNKKHKHKSIAHTITVISAVPGIVSCQNDATRDVVK